ncbi:cold shock domain-containing protein [Gammaproteobacteria bacterium]|nr:cold shock domain-containing protein [Gammaproteobacteria bacterium]
MKITLYVLASAILLTFLTVQVFSLFAINNPIVLYVTVFLSLLINSLFIHIQSKTARPSPRNQRNRGQSKRQNQNSGRAKNNSRGQRSAAGGKYDEKPDQSPTQISEDKLEGEIKWYNRRKNYGFIVESSGEELFFHQQEIEETQGRSSPIDKGQKVTFIKTETEKGPQAQRIRILK